MPDLIVINKALYYGGREHPVGSKVALTDVDAGYLIRKGRVQEPKAVPIRKVSTVRAPAAPEAVDEPKEHAVEPLSTRSLEAETPAPTAAPAKKAYHTRRLKAED